MEDWAGLYKFARLAFLALALLGIAIWLYLPRHRERLEEPARRMLEDDDARAEVAPRARGREGAPRRAEEGIR